MKYTEIEEGFIKGAEEFGIDRECIDAYLMEAQGAYDTFNEVISAAEVASGDPNFRIKMACDIISNNVSPILIKDAFDKTAEPGDIMDMIRNLFQSGANGLGSSLGQSSGTGGALLGGGGGALIGLILSRVLGINPIMGMLLAGALGGGVGHHLGSSGTEQHPASLNMNNIGEVEPPGAGTGEGYPMVESTVAATPQLPKADPIASAQNAANPTSAINGNPIAAAQNAAAAKPITAGQHVIAQPGKESIGNLPSPVSQMDKTPAPNIQANPGAPTDVSATTPKVEPLATPSAPVVNGQKSKLPGATGTPTLGTPPVQPPVQ